jgi:hypothetical protein
MEESSASAIPSALFLCRDRPFFGGSVAQQRPPRDSPPLLAFAARHGSALSARAYMQRNVRRGSTGNDSRGNRNTAGATGQNTGTPNICHLFSFLLHIRSAIPVPSVQEKISSPFGFRLFSSSDGTRRTVTLDGNRLVASVLCASAVPALAEAVRWEENDEALLSEADACGTRHHRRPHQQMPGGCAPPRPAQHRLVAGAGGVQDRTLDRAQIGSRTGLRLRAGMVRYLEVGIKIWCACVGGA